MSVDVYLQALTVGTVISLELCGQHDLETASQNMEQA